MKTFGKILTGVVILAIILGAFMFFTSKTSQTFEQICTDAGWKATKQTSSETGEQAIMCWKAENPAVVKDSYTYDCGDGNEVVYYYINREPELVKQAMGNDLFNYVASNCELG